MHRLLKRAHRAARSARDNGREVPVSLVGRISRAWDRILERAIAFHEAQPPLRTGKRGRRKRRIGHNLALRLQKQKEGCLRFLTDTRTPFTNNEAERDLRMAKLRQKISGGFRSEPSLPISLRHPLPLDLLKGAEVDSDDSREREDDGHGCGCCGRGGRGA